MARGHMLQRPSSSRSHYNPVRYQNGGGEEVTPASEGSAGDLSPTSSEPFSFADLPRLNLGSPDENAGESGGGGAGQAGGGVGQSATLFSHHACCACTHCYTKNLRANVSCVVQPQTVHDTG